MKIIFIFAQISLCLASSGPRIIAESDQEVFDPFIDIFQTSSSSDLKAPVSQTPQDIVAITLPSSTATTISWRWWRITTIAVKETTPQPLSIRLKPPASMPSSSPRPFKSSVQPSPMTATAMNTMTNVPVDASTKSPSQLRREEMGRELKKNNKILNWARILIGFIG